METVSTSQIWWEIRFTLMLRCELVSSSLSSESAAPEPKLPPPSALVGWLEASQERRDIEVLLVSSEEIC